MNVELISLTPHGVSGLKYQCNVLKGCPTGGKSGRRLDIVSSRLRDKAAHTDLFFPGKQAGLNNHLEDMLPADFLQRADLLQNGVVLSATNAIFVFSFFRRAVSSNIPA